MAHGLNKLAWVTHAVFQSSRNRPVVLGDSGPCPRSRGIDPLSRVTWSQVRGPSVYTNGPGMLGTGSEGPRFLPAVPEDSHQCPSSRGFHQLSQATHDEVRGPAVSTSCPGRFRPRSDFPRCRPAVPDDSRPCPRARGFDPLSRELGPVSECSQGRSAVPGDTGQ